MLVCSVRGSVLGQDLGRALNCNNPSSFCPCVTGIQCTDSLWCVCPVTDLLTTSLFVHPAVLKWGEAILCDNLE